MYRIGVDLGGTNIAVGVVDENMKIIGRGKVKTRAPRPAAEIFDDIALAVDQSHCIFKSLADLKLIVERSVVCPGYTDPTMTNVALDA